MRGNVLRHSLRHKACQSCVFAATERGRAPGSKVCGFSPPVGLPGESGAISADATDGALRSSTASGAFPLRPDGARPQPVSFGAAGAACSCSWGRSPVDISTAPDGVKHFTFTLLLSRESPQASNMPLIECDPAGSISTFMSFRNKQTGRAKSTLQAALRPDATTIWSHGNPGDAMKAMPPRSSRAMHHIPSFRTHFSAIPQNPQFFTIKREQSWEHDKAPRSASSLIPSNPISPGLPAWLNILPISRASR